MQIQEDHELERSELGVLLASGIFNRAPNLVQILTYICAKYFDGSQEEIKEYNIAVEALGRPAEFDQKRDSIVRVEAHRLRKRLREYYEGEGATHQVRIEIPSGQYAPRFVRTNLLSVPTTPDVVAAESAQVAIAEPQFEVLVEPAPATVSVPALGALSSRYWRRIVAIGTGVLCVAGIVAFSMAGRAPVERTKELIAPAPGNEVRILAGVAGGRTETEADTGKYVDAFSRVWSSDRFFSGGSVFRAANTHPIAGTRDPQIFQTRREGTFSYDIPLSPGVYELRLYFAETLYGDNNIAGGGETSRIFQIWANGQPLLRDFDVIEEVGPSTADLKVFKDISPAADGKLHLNFEAGTNPAFLNAIEIVPGLPGKLKPVRMVAQERGFGDRSGRFWDSDRYVKGGQLVVRNEPVAGAADPELYRGERFGNITYTIPVARPGRYSLKLYFVESWFGPGRPGGGGEQSRLFDILCNGVALRRNFDIFKEAGGQNRAVVLTFHGLEPNPQAKLVLSLIPSRNYAAINALEVEEESK